MPKTRKSLDLTQIDPGLLAALRDPAMLNSIKQRANEQLSYRELERYVPYGPQALFHASGKTFRERLLMASNQTGKTYSAAYEVTVHLTGRYPDWWEGKRFNKPISAWVIGLSSQAVRDTCQRLLLGRLSQIGTGFIPKSDIVGSPTSTRAVADAVDTVTVKHVSGGKSTLGFKSAEQGRDKLQGETLDLVWIDEEIEMALYQEALTRLTATRGILLMTFTPLKGVSDVVSMFYPVPDTADRGITRMTIDDAGHIPPEDRQKIIDGYAPHERDARARGIPMLGTGKIYAVPESDLVKEAFPIPRHWAVIGGMDFGTRNFAAVKLAHDRDTDIVYLTHAVHLKDEPETTKQVAVLKRWGDCPWAWPHDGKQMQANSGGPLAAQYREAGLDMLHTWATHAEGGGYTVEPGIQELLDRMQTGRFVAWPHLADFWDQFRNYHRAENGQPVKKHDHVMDALRIATMMLRFARPPGKGINGDKSPRRNLKCVV